MALHTRSTAVAVVGGLAALVLTAPPPSTAVAQLAGVGKAVDPTGPLVAAVALSAWAVTAWLALTVALVLLSRLPGLLGRTVGALTTCIAPRAVRRAVEASLGLTVAVGVLAPAAALAAPVPSSAPASAPATGPEEWDLDWPSLSAPPTAGASAGPTLPPEPSPTGTPRPAGSTPAPGPPAPSPPAPRTSAPTSPETTAPAPAAPAPVSPSAPAAPAPAPAGVLVVRSGDSLWSLAEASLRAAGTASPTDAQVARAWPRWWAANREAVGDDPDLLLPGTVLHPPVDSPGGR